MIIEAGHTDSQEASLFFAPPPGVVRPPTISSLMDERDPERAVMSLSAVQFRPNMVKLFAVVGVSNCGELWLLNPRC